MSKKATFLPMNLSLAPFLLVLLYHLLSCVAVHGVQEKKILSLHNNIWSPRKSYEAPSSCFSHNLGKGRESSTTLKMKHRELCSGKTIDWGKKLRRALTLDNLRVQSLQLRIKAMSSTTTESISEAQIPLTSGMTLQTLNYIVTVDLGGRNMTLIVDTGSDLTWVQCQPCKSCYNQEGPLYDPSVSSSYKTVFCNSSTCQDLVAATGNSGLCGGDNGVDKTTCDYVVSYGDGSYTRGNLGSESIQLGDTKVESFVFGCGRSNKGLFGGASGLMGLGRSSVSLVSQTLKNFNGVFSYCLPSLEDGASGSLSFGEDSSVYKNTTSVSYTPLVQNPQLSSFYVLNLTGASIGGVDLESSSFGGGILIDSGTVITRLPPSIYKAVKTEFLKQFSGFPSAPSYSILDTCFNLTSYEDVSIPTIKMIFQGNAELEVDVTGVFYFVKPDASLVCLALASLSYENDVGILGNYQQKNQRVIYDTKQEKLGIAGENCSF
ncbi:Eukaryotic aspartyl protease family protein [Raphanus sativus]|uniref:Aspartyl protease family protein At5g10770 isoform X1 n=2 Tax=Raphanus sativus TaxID=3726 RepID=A0A6J0KDP2_RAPSA|nr:aspartyl protease family protein At5g10770 isoform X1 [Raphanus sativus]KAJ4884762.1 Eukaryotic aspartyl protease family protein [Raphanus sativus]